MRKRSATLIAIVIVAITIFLPTLRTKAQFDEVLVTFSATVGGTAYTIDESDQGIEKNALETSLPVSEVYGFAPDGENILYRRQENGVPTGDGLAAARLTPLNGLSTGNL